MKIFYWEAENTEIYWHNADKIMCTFYYYYEKLSLHALFNTPIELPRDTATESSF